MSTQATERNAIQALPARVAQLAREDTCITIILFECDTPPSTIWLCSEATLYNPPRCDLLFSPLLVAADFSNGTFPGI